MSHLKFFVAAFLCAVASDATAAPTTHPIFVSGADENRLTVTILSEGYRAVEQGRFLQDATNLVNAFFRAEPYTEYKSYFNAYAVFVESAESGSDHPGYPVFQNTFFNSSYDAADHLITIPSGAMGMGKVTSILNSTVPATDLPVLLVNDLVNGGSGGSLLIVSKSASSSEILIHESGHTLARLGDEYTDASNFIPATEPPNTTRQTDRAMIKWKAWIPATTPVPTPPAAEFDSVIGLFEGAQNQSNGWFRPKLNCGMRSLGQPFCEVCREALVKAIYQRVRPAESFAPAEHRQTLRSLEPLAFTIQKLQPASHSLDVQWYLDGSAIENETNESFVMDPKLLAKGFHSVHVELRDPTDWVRNDLEDFLTQSVHWEIEKPFPESTRPVVTVSSPANRARLTNSEIIISGSARDNIGVASVLYQLNDGSFLPAAGTGSWTVPVTLLPGSNVVRVKSIDVSGNESPVISRVLTHVVLSPLQLIISGNGRVTGAENGNVLEVGHVYRARAIAANGNLFHSWSGGLSSTNASLMFAMQTNLALQANFIVNPFLQLQGDYAGLFRNDEILSFISSGMIVVKVRSTGTFSGKLSMIDGDYSFSGKFSPEKVASVEVRRRNKATLRLTFSLDAENQIINGVVVGADWQSALLAERAAESDAARVGTRLTAYVPGFMNDTNSLGDSVATITVGRRDLRIAGMLADGGRFTQAARCTAGGWPLFWRSKDAGIAFGWSAEIPGQSGRISGEIDFLKIPSNPLYENGMAHRSELKSSLFRRPVGSERILNFSIGKLLFEGANLSEPLRADVVLDSRNRLLISGLENASLRLSSANGLLTGSLRHPATGLPSSVNAVLMQDRTNVAGLFLGTNESGRISLEIPE